MKRQLLAILVLVVSRCVIAQGPTGIVLERASALVNEPVKVVINFAAADPWCGLRLDFGDGDVRDVVVEEFPLTVTKKYSSAGRYVLRAEGRALPRGLRSAAGCTGAARSAALDVLDGRRDEPAATPGPRVDDRRARPPREAEDRQTSAGPRDSRETRAASNAATPLTPGRSPTVATPPPRPPPTIKKPRDDTLESF